jgi:hypothetical protein
MSEISNAIGTRTARKTWPIARKLKLEGWSTGYGVDSKKENVDHELVHLSHRMSELQYNSDIAGNSQSLLRGYPKIS